MPLNSPILTGDVSGGLHSTSVDKIKTHPVDATTPTAGQTLTWTGSAWAPATPSTGGGGGANGLTYFLRYDVAPDAPTTNLPGSPKQLGRTGSSVAASVTSGTLANNVWTLLAGFVSESTPQDPATTLIPGGLWDFSVWALGTANIAAPTYIRAKVYRYNNSTAPTLLATSGELPINSVSAKISLSALVPTTVVADTDRIYVEIEARATANNHTATLQFNDGQPSNVATSLPLVGGTGLWKNTAGVLQSPASLLVDADVDSAAAIAQSKISGLTDALANVSAPGTYYEFFEQFFATNPLLGNLVFGATGGSNTALNTGFGTVGMSTGTTAAINQQSRLVQPTNAQVTGTGSARAIFRVGQGGTTWFDATLTGAFRCGWGDSVTGESANGIYFRVQNGQGIDFVTKLANSETLTSTGVSFSNGTFQSLEILINSSGTQAVAKIDGVTVATHSTTIPVGRLIFFSHINRTVATGTAVVANMDSIYLRITPNTPFF